ncbi:MAG: hypothetical protein DELT_00810 [Desulfovibrio sp.]
MTDNNKALSWLRLAISVFWVVWQFYLVRNPSQPMFQQPLHLCLALMLVFLWVPLKSPAIGKGLRVAIDAVLFLTVAACLAYFMYFSEHLSTRMETIDPIEAIDIAVFFAMTLTVLECVRRVVGWSLLAVILVFLLYAVTGRYFPGWFRFGGLPIPELTEIMTMTPNGLFGITTTTSVLFVFYFIAFGAFYNAVGGTKLFMDIGLSLVGRHVGGAAKTAIISSGLMGCISGSAVANVAATGVFTIPLMKRSGFSGERAGATEAIASTGGQLMPPVMGVAAFVMAELLQVHYTDIALAGLIPALLYYLALFVNVDLSARATGIGTLGKDVKLEFDPILPRLYLLLPPVMLIALLFVGYSATYAAAAAIIACPVASCLKWKNRITLKELMEAVNDAGKQAAQVAVPIAAIGIIIAVAVQSNLALKFSTRLMDISGGTLYGAMIFVVIGCLIMGMGLPTVAAYIIGAVLFAPALVKLGIPELGAHFFVMYFCVLSMITPPVALASYTAAGLAKADPTRTGLLAFKMSAVIFLIPFAFAFDPGLLGQGSWHTILLALVSVGLSILAWVAAGIGWFKRTLRTPERLALAVAAVAVILAPTGSVHWAIAIAILALAGIWVVMTSSLAKAKTNAL